VTTSIRVLIKGIPKLGHLARKIYWDQASKETRRKRFSNSISYWEKRYSSGGNSGPGSYGKLAEFKATTINEFVAKHDLRSVIEFGCGDGNQLILSEYPAYLGFDVSETAVTKCKELFEGDATKRFRLLTDYKGEKADLALSLDVIFHLIEDDVFTNHMNSLFESSNQYAIIYSSDFDGREGYQPPHVRHRNFTTWIQRSLPQWKLIEHIPNKYPYQGDYTQGSFSDFFVYAKAQTRDEAILNVPLNV
jgi:SAM-dependent methyltransferase